MLIAASASRRLVAVLVLALAVRSMAVPGYMPGAGELVTLCSYGGPIQVLVDPETGTPVDESPHSDGGDCPWAGGVAPAASDAGAFAFGTPAPASAAVQEPTRSGFPRSFHHLHPVRGPPTG